MPDLAAGSAALPAPIGQCFASSPPATAPAPVTSGVSVQAPDVLVDRDQRGHQLIELGEVQLLLRVRKRLFGVRMDLDHHPVRPDGDAADRERLDQPALAGGVARDRRRPAGA
jgi:hypothetical protein